MVSLDRATANIKMSYMNEYIKDMNPYPLSPEEWRQIITVPAVREAWGLQADEKPTDFAAMVYGAKFDFSSGSPGYIGEIFILQGDALTGYPPLVLRRADDGTLIVCNEEN